MKKLPPTFFLVFFFLNVFSQDIFHAEIKPFFKEDLKPFYFGVASGDPHPDGIVIWTKIISENNKTETVDWEMATDTAMQNTVRSGTQETDISSAYTVKIFVKNLSPGTTYYYRFKNKNIYSPIGRTKTAPAGSPRLLRLAVVSCADFQMGQFNAYGHIAQRNDIDAIVHLGDYIYEYGSEKWGRKRTDRAMIRAHIPAHTCTTLKDYRTRYAQYRLDPQLQECHRLHPFITIWDDHEISNNINAGKTGEKWEQREAAARQAYFEWLPIRDNPQRSIIRSFKFGDLAEMWMLDGRLEGRSPQASGKDDPDLKSTDRHMLGSEQTEWMLNGMKNSTAKWKVMGNQVVFSPLNDSKVFDRRPAIRMDRWDGYPAERQYIFDFFYKNNINNVIVVTGDVHTAWAIDLVGKPFDKNFYDPKTGKGVIGAEFVTPSITSFNLDELVPKAFATIAKRRLKKKKNNPHLKYLDLVRHGYFTLTLTPEKAQADWYFIKRKDRVDLKIGKRKKWHILADGKSLMKR
ncbi:MAG TPA: hypothetical protein ENJ95_19325 [Bacteroidetes bacterium]|nr:hypothetical protein [Bacteroidota bacterium]